MLQGIVSYKNYIYIWKRIIYLYIYHALEGNEHIRTNLHVITAIEQFINIMMHKKISIKFTVEY